MEFISRKMGADTEVPDDGGFTPLLNSGIIQRTTRKMFTCPIVINDVMLRTRKLAVLYVLVQQYA